MSADNMKKESRTDWTRIEALRDEDIVFSDSPELAEDFFKEAVPWPARKRQITLRLDQEVIDFFKSQGRGYQTAINNVLQRYVETHKYIKTTSTESDNRNAAVGEKSQDQVREHKMETWSKRDVGSKGNG